MFCKCKESLESKETSRNNSYATLKVMGNRIREISFSGTPLYDAYLIRTPVYNGQFYFSRRKAHVFFPKLTRLMWTKDTSLQPPRVTNSHRLPRLRTLVICVLSVTEYLTSENLTKTANDLQKFLSNIKSIWLSRNRSSVRK